MVVPPPYHVWMGLHLFYRRGCQRWLFFVRGLFTEIVATKGVTASLFITSFMVKAYSNSVQVVLEKVFENILLHQSNGIPLQYYT